MQPTYVGVPDFVSDVDVEKGEQCIKTGEEVLKSLSFQDETVAGACVALIIMIGGFNALAYAALRSKKRSYEKLKASSS